MREFFTGMVVVIITIGVIILLLFGCYKISTNRERTEDSGYLASYNIHNENCDGNVYLVSASRAYGESTRYFFTCDKCGEIFAFYDYSEVMNATNKR